MSYYDGKKITPTAGQNHFRGHDVRYIGTNETGDDLVRCYTCHPPLLLRIGRAIMSWTKNLK